MTAQELVDRGNVLKAELGPQITQASEAAANASILNEQAQGLLRSAQAEAELKAADLTQKNAASDRLLETNRTYDVAIDQAADAGRKRNAAADLRKNQRVEDDARAAELETEAMALEAEAEKILVPQTAPSPLVGDPQPSPSAVEPTP